jgi:CRISPR-associated protein Cmr6
MPNLITSRDEQRYSSVADGSGRLEDGRFGSISGHNLFHDAWITPESLAGSLKRDVMTPHHPQYYMASKDSDIAPTDFDDPNPVAYLSVAGAFRVVVSCDVEGDDGGKWANLALKLVCEALDRWGVGGKTSSGYGRLG